MTLSLIEPYGLYGIGAIPRKCYLTQVYYLGYGRNAWHSTWINRYSPNSVSFDVLELKALAEKRRVQGSVAKILSLPMLVVEAVTNGGNIRAGIAPMNDRGPGDYSRMTQDLKLAEPELWRRLPSHGLNWLLTFGLKEGAIVEADFVPSFLGAQSYGASYKLGWRPIDNVQSYSGFMKFAMDLKGLMEKTAQKRPTD